MPRAKPTRRFAVLSCAVAALLMGGCLCEEGVPSVDQSIADVIPVDRAMPPDLTGPDIPGDKAPLPDQQQSLTTLWALGFNGKLCDMALDKTEQVYANFELYGPYPVACQYSGGTCCFSHFAKVSSLSQSLWQVVGSGIGFALDAAGKHIWTGTGFQDRVCFGSHVLKATSGTDYALAELDTKSGAWLSASLVGKTASSVSIATGARVFVVNSSGGFFLAGSFSGATTLGGQKMTASGAVDGFVGLLGAKGAAKWIATYSSPPIIASTIRMLKVDDKGQVYVIGDAKGTTKFGTISLAPGPEGGRYSFLARVSASGKWDWAVRATTDGVAGLYGLALDTTGAPHVTGYFSGKAQFGSTVLKARGSADVVVARLDTSGKVTWASRAGGDIHAGGFDLDLTSGGDIFVTGTYATSEGGKADFGPVTLRGHDNNTSSAKGDVFVAQLNSAGSFIKAVSAGGKWGDSGTSIALGSSGYLYVGGEYGSQCQASTNAAVFGHIILSKTSSLSRGFLWKLKP